MHRGREERRGVGGKERGREGERNVEGAKGEVGRGQVRARSQTCNSS